MTNFETTITQGKRRLVKVSTADNGSFSNLMLSGDGRTSPGPDPSSQFYARALAGLVDSTITVSIDTPTGPSSASLLVHTVASPVAPDVALEIADEEPDPEA